MAVSRRRTSIFLATITVTLLLFPSFAEGMATGYAATSYTAVTVSSENAISVHITNGQGTMNQDVVLEIIFRDNPA